MKLSNIFKSICCIVLNVGTALYGAPDFSMTGYASVNGEGVNITTGGNGGTFKTITNLMDLKTWSSSREKDTTPETVIIKGKISSDSTVTITIKNGANISILGDEVSGGELQNVGINIRDYRNVIVRNLKIYEVFYPDDALTLDNVVHGWVDHCELYSKIGPGITVDTYDGLLDIKKGSRYITISWCHIHDHMKCSLVGHTDNTGQQVQDGQIRVTYHHNWFSNTDGRNPSIRFGAVHMFNNYFENITDYGIAARDGAHAKLENNIYFNVVLPMSTDKFPVEGLPNGYICESGNRLTGTTGQKVISQTGCNFWNSTTMPYKYTLDSVSTVEQTVKMYSGILEKSTSVSKHNEMVVNHSFTNTVELLTGSQITKTNLLYSLEIYSINGIKIPQANIRNRSHLNGVYIFKKLKR